VPCIRVVGYQLFISAEALHQPCYPLPKLVHSSRFHLVHAASVPPAATPEAGRGGVEEGVPEAQVCSSGYALHDSLSPCFVVIVMTAVGEARRSAWFVLLPCPVAHHAVVTGEMLVAGVPNGSVCTDVFLPVGPLAWSCSAWSPRWSGVSAVRQVWSHRRLIDSL
jgi:hypothetical protein